jgi:hypothetical protein
VEFLSSIPGHCLAERAHQHIHHYVCVDLITENEAWSTLLLTVIPLTAIVELPPPTSSLGTIGMRYSILREVVWWFADGAN